MAIKTSELISRLIFASEESCKCEDENFFRTLEKQLSGKSKNDPVTFEDVTIIVRAATDFSRFASIRTTCEVLQELGIAENDVDVMNNEEFRSELAKTYNVN